MLPIKRKRGLSPFYTTHNDILHVCLVNQAPTLLSVDQEEAKVHDICMGGTTKD